MIAISNNLKNYIQNDGTLNARIKVYEVEEGTNDLTGEFERTETLIDTLEGDGDIVSISVDESIADEEGFIGFTSSRSINLEIFTYDAQGNKHDLSGKEVKLEMWCEELPNEIIDYGYYVVSQDNTDIGKETSKYTAYDYMIKLDTPFVDSHQYESRVPEGYTEGNYIELSGITNENVYLDTGITLNQDSEVELTVANLPSTNTKIFGSIAETPSNSNELEGEEESEEYGTFSILTNNGNLVLTFGDNVLTTPIPSDEIIYIRISNQALEVNGVKQVISSYTNFETPNNAYLFNVTGEVPSGYYSPNMRLYSCKIYENGDLVKEYIPCSSQTNGIGLYNITNEEFLTIVNAVSLSIDSVTFTQTLKEFLLEMLAPTGIQLGSTTFSNENFVINRRPYFENETRRNVLRAISQMAGTFARIGVDNKLYINGFNNTSEELTEDNTFELTEQEKAFGPVNSLTLGASGSTDGDEVIVEDAQSIETNGRLNITIEDNPFMANDDEINRAKQGLFNAINGIKFKPFEAKYYGYIYWECGDKITENGNDTYILRHSFALYGDGNVSAPSLTSTEIKYQSTSVLSAFKTAKLELDRVNAQITSLASDLGDTVDTSDLDALYERIKNNEISPIEGSISQLTQTTNNLVASFTNITNDESSESGNVGNLKNTTVTIDVNGISVQAYGSVIRTLTANEGFFILKNDEVYASFTTEGIIVDNLTSTQYLTAGNHRIEGYEDNGKRTGWFYIGG